VIEFKCPGCGIPYHASDDKAGRTARCVKCGAPMDIPGVSGARSGRAPPVETAESRATARRGAPEGDGQDMEIKLRRMLTGLDPREYEHAWDRKALDALQRIKGFDFLVRKYSEHINERVLRVLHTGSHIRVTQSSFPGLHDAFDAACAVLGLEFTPELYIEWDYSVNASAIGVEQPVVVLNSGSVDLLSTDELVWLLGHELGHIKSGHMLYTQIAELFPFLAGVIGEATLGLGRLLTSSVHVALFYWYRMSEFTADRAGMLACQDQEAALRAMVKMAGLPRRMFGELQIDAFVQQAREFEGLDSSTLNWIAKLMLTMHRTHPWTVMRAHELLKWIEAGEYEAVLDRRAVPVGGQQPASTRMSHLSRDNQPMGPKSQTLQQ